jgi:hypothetical protein
MMVEDGGNEYSGGGVMSVCLAFSMSGKRTLTLFAHSHSFSYV